MAVEKHYGIRYEYQSVYQSGSALIWPIQVKSYSSLFILNVNLTGLKMQREESQES